MARLRRYGLATEKESESKRRKDRLQNVMKYSRNQVTIPQVHHSIIQLHSESAFASRIFRLPLAISR